MIPAILLSVLLAATPASAAGKVSVNTLDLLPPEDGLSGWQAGERRTVASSRGLYDYMNGGAEIYIDYGFEDLAVGEWMSPGGNPLKVEVYRMGRPKSAYGMFTQDTWGEPIDVGQGAQIQGGTLRFWKGAYFVRVFMWRGYKENLATILDVGRSVAGRIREDGDIPALVSLLPTESLVAGGLHFFHTSLTLGTFYYLSERNPLALSGETDGAIGEYVLDDGSTVFLLLVSYPDTESASRGFEGCLSEAGFSREAVEADEKGREVFTGRADDLWRTIVKWRAYVLLTLDCPSENGCAAILEKTASNLERFAGKMGAVEKQAGAECRDR